MKTHRLLFYTLGSILFFAACKNNNSSGKHQEISKTPLEIFSKRLAEIDPATRSGSDVGVFFELSGAAFNSSLILDPLAWEQYSVNPILAAANLGIYTTDAIYQYGYGVSEGAYASWMAAKSLAQEIGMDEVFDEIIIKRVEEGLTPDDSIVFKLNDAMLKAELKISESERMRVFTALLAGGYVEKLHIVMGTIWDGYDNMPEDVRLLLVQEMLVYLLHQLSELNSLIALIEEHETIDDRGILAYEMKKMRDSYASLDVSFDNVSNLSAEQIVTNPKAIALRQSVSDIRTYLTEGIEP